MKKIYIMLSKTDTIFCSLIQRYTKEPYAHVSLLFSDDFKFGYSFSRKKVKNPFLGGLMKEDYFKWVEAFPETDCLIYELEITSKQHQALVAIVDRFYSKQKQYKYNLPGVIGNLFHIKITPKNRYFCSQFVSTVLEEAGTISFDKDPLFVTAIDFKNHPRLNLIYEGSLMALLHATNTYPESMTVS